MTDCYYALFYRNSRGQILRTGGSKETVGRQIVGTSRSKKQWVSRLLELEVLGTPCGDRLLELEGLRKHCGDRLLLRVVLKKQSGADS